MKRYPVIVAVFIISISIVSYYLFIWSEISKTKEHLTNIEQLTYELQIVDKKHISFLKELRTRINYNEIAESTRILNSNVYELIEELRKSNDSSLIKLSNEIESKVEHLNIIYEDLKMDNAEIKNSLTWLSTNYRDYLDNKGSSDSPNADTMKYIFYIITKSMENNTEQLENFDKLDIKVQTLKIHMAIIHKEHNQIAESMLLLMKYDITPSLQEISSRIDKLLNEINDETSTIFKFLSISTIFLIIFAISIYYKEIMTRLALAKLKNELQQFVDALNESAIVSKTDTKGFITYVNNKFCEVSGYKRDELIGKPHNIIRHPNMSSSVFKELWRTIQNKKIFRGTIENRTKDNRSYYVDTVIMPIFDIKGDVVEYMAVRYEVTELVLSRDTALIAEKAKGEFLSNMSHELRTPLNAIKGFSVILSREVKDKKHSEYLKNILESSEHLIGLINDILDLSKLQSGKFTLDYHDFNAWEKMSQLLTRFDTQIDASGVNLEISLNDNLRRLIKGDWLRVSQVITNLVSNALKFTDSGKSVYFNAEYERGELFISIMDEGIGMSKEAQEKIFHPFEQADSSTTRKFGGTGLGLSIVVSLIEQMNGKINLSSREGVGTQFEIVLPIEESEHKEKVFEEIIESDKEKLNGHILIAEDNKTNQMLIGILIDELGLTYTMVNDGVDAVEKFAKEKFDLVLMDENMPNLNGTEAMKQIRSIHGNDTPIVALTANVMSGDKERFIEAGMNAYVAKPIDDDELYRVLKSFLNVKS